MRSWPDAALHLLPSQIVGKHHEGNEDRGETDGGVEPNTSHVQRYLQYAFTAVVPVRMTRLCVRDRFY